MRMILAALPLLAALGACQTFPGPNGPGGYPSPYPPPGPAMEGYRAIGTEPFWDLTIGRDMIFNDRGTGLQVSQPTPAPIHGVAGETYNTRRIHANIVHGRCSDGMSDRVYPDSVQLSVDGRAYRGCGGSGAFFDSAGPDGNALPTPSLAQTNWTVTELNGRPVPRGGYYINFMPDRLNARFGCNSLGAGYRVDGKRLSAGAVMATRMACPDMSFETAASKVMALPMSIAAIGDRLTLSNRAGSIDLVRAR